MSITALRNEDGSLRGFAKIVSDITGRRAAEEALRSRESHLRSILSTVPDAMVVIDDQGMIVSFSAAAERLFGYQEAELLGVNVSRLMPSPDRERHDVGSRSMVDAAPRFDTPSLRFVARSAPYFHDGSAATLGDAVDHFVRFLAVSPPPTPQERDDLIAYLRSL